MPDAPVRIQRKREKGWRMPANTVYVGRPGPWGNPFIANNEGVGMECVAMDLDADYLIDRAAASADLYRRWLTGGKVNRLIACFLPTPDHAPPKLHTIKRALAGKNLACWCPLDHPCHADVLLELANVPVCEAVP